jgi:multidrug efflux pump subunit AcrA (membrane-fusion protein)
MMTGKSRRLLMMCLLMAILMMAGCQGADEQKPLPTLVLDNDASPATQMTQAPQGQTAGRSGEVIASGNLKAGREIKLGASAAGLVYEVQVRPGDTVTAGQTLARLGGAERLAAALAAARLELLTAEQTRQALDDHWAEEQSQAALRLARANQVLEDARTKREGRAYRRGSDSMIALAQADVILAADRLKQAEEAYNAVSNQDDASVIKAGALSAYSAAQRAKERAQANLDYLIALPDPLEVALAEAELEAAQAEADAARSELDRLQNGPNTEVISLAEARIAAAQAQVEAAAAALDELEILAPIDATVAEVNVTAGEWAAPGQTLVVLVALSHLLVETSDLSERNVARVSNGQIVTVMVKALGEKVTGKVEHISPLADTLGGDVIYRTTIRLDANPPGALPGMSVDVIFK